MAEKKAEKVEKTEKAPKIEKEKKPAKTVKKTTEKYFYAVGRRKTSVAQVRVYENDKATDADLLVNGKTLKEYFPALSLQNNILAPFKTAGLGGKVKMTVIVRGGGFNGQADAVRLGISRALVLMNAEFKKSLKDLGFLTRDSREVERKKPGLKKARKAPQWAKR